MPPLSLVRQSSWTAVNIGSANPPEHLAGGCPRDRSWTLGFPVILIWDVADVVESRSASAAEFAEKDHMANTQPHYRRIVENAILMNRLNARGLRSTLACRIAPCRDE